MIPFLGLITLIYLFLHAEPIEWLKKFLLVSSDTKTKYHLHLAAIKLINCAMCTGFWVGLIYYQDLFMASILSLSSEIFSVIMSRLNKFL